MRARSSERGRARKQEVDRETNRELKQRMAEAQKAADELMARERQAAEARCRRAAAGGLRRG